MFYIDTKKFEDLMPVYATNQFNLTPALIDNNQKVIIAAAIAKLAPEGDEFGTVFDSVNWTKILEQNGTITENAGVLRYTRTGTPMAVVTKRNYLYKDLDLVAHISETDCLLRPYGSDEFIKIYRSPITHINYSYIARAPVGFQKFFIEKRINGVYSVLFSTIDYGLIHNLKLRVRRDSSTNTWWFYHDGGAGWVLDYTAVITDATYFPVNSDVYPQLEVSQVTIADPFVIDFTKYYQETSAIPAQRFWSDSPEFYIINSPGDEYAFDAGIGLIWFLTGLSCTKSEPGSSTVKFKIGVSDTGLLVGTTWIDATWKTIAQVNNNALSGLYNGHRYIHIITQFNSSSEYQPTLTNFSLSGYALAGINLGIDIKDILYGTKISRVQKSPLVCGNSKILTSSII
jgi:hypothetical protein